VQQFAGSPFFINIFLQAAREKHVSLISYLDCERLYVDELFGGHIHRHFADLLEEISSRLDTRHLLIRLLWEAVAGEDPISSFELWRKRLHMSATELEDVLHRLHVQEFVNWDETTVEAGVGPQGWKDYLKIRYRLDVVNEPRALVVADMLADSLKRAPHTMARHYKQNANTDFKFRLSTSPRGTLQLQRLQNQIQGRRSSGNQRQPQRRNAVHQTASNRTSRHLRIVHRRHASNLRRRPLSGSAHIRRGNLL
jgi:hypothetical protein